MNSAQLRLLVGERSVCIVKSVEWDAGRVIALTEFHREHRNMTPVFHFLEEDMYRDTKPTCRKPLSQPCDTGELTVVVEAVMTLILPAREIDTLAAASNYCQCLVLTSEANS
jgi:hypothetical protein